jgi:hypothetical protein
LSILLCILIEPLWTSFQYVIDVGLLGNDRRTRVLLIGLAGGAVLVALPVSRALSVCPTTASVLNDARRHVHHLKHCLPFSANRPCIRAVPTDI